MSPESGPQIEQEKGLKPETQESSALRTITSVAKKIGARALEIVTPKSPAALKLAAAAALIGAPAALVGTGCDTNENYERIAKLSAPLTSNDLNTITTTTPVSYPSWNAAGLKSPNQYPRRLNGKWVISYLDAAGRPFIVSADTLGDAITGQGTAVGPTPVGTPGLETASFISFGISPTDTSSTGSNGNSVALYGPGLKGDVDFNPINGAMQTPNMGGAGIGFGALTVREKTTGPIVYRQGGSALVETDMTLPLSSTTAHTVLDPNVPSINECGTGDQPGSGIAIAPERSGGPGSRCEAATGSTMVQAVDENGNLRQLSISNNAGVSSFINPRVMTDTDTGQRWLVFQNGTSGIGYFVLPPIAQPQPDGGVPDAGHDGGTPDGGRDGGVGPDAGHDGGTPDGGQDGGVVPDAGHDSGRPDASTEPDGGVRDGGETDAGPNNQPCFALEDIANGAAPESFDPLRDKFSIEAGDCNYTVFCLTSQGGHTGFESSASGFGTSSDVCEFEVHEDGNPNPIRVKFNYSSPYPNSPSAATEEGDFGVDIKFFPTDTNNPLSIARRGLTTAWNWIKGGNNAKFNEDPENPDTHTTAVGSEGESRFAMAKWAQVGTNEDGTPKMGLVYAERGDKDAKLYLQVANPGDTELLTRINPNVRVVTSPGTPYGERFIDREQGLDPVPPAPDFPDPDTPKESCSCISVEAPAGSNSNGLMVFAGMLATMLLRRKRGAGGESSSPKRGPNKRRPRPSRADQRKAARRRTKAARRRNRAA